jgi:DNA-binding NarL/FixJ family response regulator
VPLTAAVRADRLVIEWEGARTPALVGLDASLPLTSREREIATMAQRGMTNGALAEHLVISVRTLDNHLDNSYEKLGITHRDELAPDPAPTTSSRSACHEP